MMLASLPIQDCELLIRQWTRRDLDDRAAWPPYPEPYRAFDATVKLAGPEQRDRRFASQDSDRTQLTLTVDHRSDPCVGYIALHHIDWQSRTVGNAGVRIHPLWCDRGIGTRVLRSIASYCRDCGLLSFRLDASPLNTRALRCYEKIGFERTGSDLWRNDPSIRNKDLWRKEHADLRPHVRFVEGIPQVRFWWLELDLRGIG